MRACALSWGDLSAPRRKVSRQGLKTGPRAACVRRSCAARRTPAAGSHPPGGQRRARRPATRPPQPPPQRRPGCGRKAAASGERRQGRRSEQRRRSRPSAPPQDRPRQARALWRRPRPERNRSEEGARDDISSGEVAPAGLTDCQPGLCGPPALFTRRPDVPGCHRTKRARPRTQCARPATGSPCVSRRSSGNKPPAPSSQGCAYPAAGTSCRHTGYRGGRAPPSCSDRASRPAGRAPAPSR